MMPTRRGTRPLGETPAPESVAPPAGSGELGKALDAWHREREEREPVSAGYVGTCFTCERPRLLVLRNGAVWCEKCETTSHQPAAVPSDRAEAREPVFVDGVPTWRCFCGYAIPRGMSCGECGARLASAPAPESTDAERLEDADRPLAITEGAVPVVVRVTRQERAYMNLYRSLSSEEQRELRAYAASLGLRFAAPESVAPPAGSGEPVDDSAKARDTQEWAHGFASEYGLSDEQRGALVRELRKSLKLKPWVGVWVNPFFGCAMWACLCPDDIHHPWTDERCEECGLLRPPPAATDAPVAHAGTGTEDAVHNALMSAIEEAVMSCHRQANEDRNGEPWVIDYAGIVRLVKKRHLTAAQSRPSTEDGARD